jgi:hypothetical protein
MANSLVRLFNEVHSQLRLALRDPQHPDIARALFLKQHAIGHARQVSDANEPTYADEVLTGLKETAWRTIPEGAEHSIAWIVWHISRIEDAAMNIVLANRQQVFNEGGWQKKLNIALTDTGNLLSMEKILQLSKDIDLEAVLEYRQQVGRRTRENFLSFEPLEWKRKADPQRVARLIPEGAVAPYATGVVEYWGGLTYAGLLLMPPTRHNFIHLNEIKRMR